MTDSLLRRAFLQRTTGLAALAATAFSGNGAAPQRKPMAYSSLIDLDGQKFDILGGSIAFSRPVDSKGRPGQVQGGQFSISVEVTPESKLIEAMVNSPNTPYKKGELTFTDAGSSGVLHKIEFENAYIVSYSEAFLANDNSYTCDVTFSAEKITIQTAVFDQRWPK